MCPGAKGVVRGSGSFRISIALVERIIEGTFLR